MVISMPSTLTFLLKVSAVPALWTSTSRRLSSRLICLANCRTESSDDRSSFLTTICPLPVSLVSSSVKITRHH
ncbi:hypothetical protein TKK_0007275 [Trichogramma kaykai]